MPKKPLSNNPKSSATKQGPRAVASYELPVELSEKQIEADVAGYFGYLSAIAGEFSRFRLLDVDEQVTGADKSFIDGAVAYYLQFKKPCGLKPMTQQEAATKPRSKASQKQAVRRYRFDEKLDQFPYSISFRLHPMASTATQLQHNILRSYENPPFSRAVYICPLELTSSKYTASMTPLDWDEYPLSFRPFQWIREAKFVAHAARMVPYLRGHAAIVPHTQVSSAEHCYSFSYTATDVAFHSPTLLSPGPTRLSDFVGAEVDRIGAAEVKPTVSELVRTLRRIAATWLDDGDNIEGEDDFEWLHEHGRLLRRKHAIRQVVLLRRRTR